MSCSVSPSPKKIVLFRAEFLTCSTPGVLRGSHRTDELIYCKVHKHAASGSMQAWQKLPDFSKGPGAGISEDILYLERQVIYQSLLKTSRSISGQYRYRLTLCYRMQQQS